MPALPPSNIVLHPRTPSPLPDPSPHDDAPYKARANAKARAIQQHQDQYKRALLQCQAQATLTRYYEAKTKEANKQRSPGVEEVDISLDAGSSSSRTHLVSPESSSIPTKSTTASPTIRPSFELDPHALPGHQRSASTKSSCSSNSAPSVTTSFPVHSSESLVRDVYHAGGSVHHQENLAQEEEVVYLPAFAGATHSKETLVQAQEDVYHAGGYVHPKEALVQEEGVHSALSGAAQPEGEPSTEGGGYI